MKGEIEKIKNLRDQTGFSFAEIKKALSEADGDIVRAVEVLKAHGASIALKKASRETGEGVVEAYIHATKKIGALIELRCETDFVARNVEFQKLAHELAMQVASMDPGNTNELLKQPYIRDQDITVGELIGQYVAKLGENIKIENFSRLEIISP